MGYARAGLNLEIKAWQELGAWLPSELSVEMLDGANRCQLNLLPSHLNPS